MLTSCNNLPFLPLLHSLFPFGKYLFHICESISYLCSCFLFPSQQWLLCLLSFRYFLVHLHGFIQICHILVEICIFYLKFCVKPCESLKKFIWLIIIYQATKYTYIKQVYQIYLHQTKSIKYTYIKQSLSNIPTSNKVYHIYLPNIPTSNKVYQIYLHQTKSTKYTYQVHLHQTKSARFRQYRVSPSIKLRNISKSSNIR